MKKIYLIALSLICAGTMNAQKMVKKSVMYDKTHKSLPSPEAPNQPAFHIGKEKAVAKKTRAVPFWTEDFGSGNSTTLPTGWTAVANLGSGTWKWMKTASASTYNIGTLSSTTAANGWMIYDVDSIHTANGGSSPIDGSLTSPTINCSGHATVMLRMQQHYRQFYDSCTISVSNNGGTTWTKFDVLPNNTLGPNTSLPSNPHNYYLNITSVAANQANVKIRFNHGVEANGGYAWLIDDLSLSELDPVDASISKSFIAYIGDGGFASYSSIPKSLSDSIIFATNLSNIGSSALTNVPLTAITSTTTVVNNQNTTYASLPVNAIDSIVQFDNTYLPATVADYSTGFKVNAPSDAISFNDIDSCFFSVSDSIFSQNVGNLGGYYVHRAASGTTTEGSFWQGTLFEIADGKSDTLSAIFASFSSSTTVNSKLVAKVYKFDGTNWVELFQSNLKTLTSSQISTSSALKFARFELPFSADKILGTGTYAAVLDPSSELGSSNNIVVFASDAPTDIFTAGVFDDVDFGTNGLPSGSSKVPMVQLDFGRLNTTAPDRIEDYSNILALNAAPNPASSSVNFNITLKESANNVTINLTNALGQTVKSVNIGSLNANQANSTQVKVSDLASGLYIYTIHVNGQTYSNKLMIK